MLSSETAKLFQASNPTALSNYLNGQYKNFHKQLIRVLFIPNGRNNYAVKLLMTSLFYSESLKVFFKSYLAVD